MRVRRKVKQKATRIVFSAYTLFSNVGHFPVAFTCFPSHSHGVFVLVVKKQSGYFLNAENIN